jgi:DNA-binding CsgD family transcriptional regulator
MKPLSQREHEFLYERAMQGSRKDAARVMGMNRHTAHHVMAAIFRKLEVDDLAGAFRRMGWLRPVPYGVTEADVRDERRAWGGSLEEIEHDFWDRMSRHE